MDGRLSVQDAAAQLAVELLDPQPGERILDACAAPGGKTCHVLERTNGQAEVTALDVAEPRLSAGAARTSTGSDCRPGWWRPTSANVRGLVGRPAVRPRAARRAVLGAPGVIRRHPDIKMLRRAKDIPALARTQGDLLAAAWAVVKPGGRLLYTSCSVLAAENERVVAGFLRRDTTEPAT